MNENNEVNNDIYLCILEQCDTALLWFLKPDQSLNEIEPFEPQRTTGIFGTLVSNDRAPEWVEGE